jgi:hypothetical protein
LAFAAQRSIHFGFWKLKFRIRVKKIAMKRSLFIIILTIFLASCSTGLVNSESSSAYPTPTNNPLFSSSQTGPQKANSTPSGTMAAPTVAGIFKPDLTSTARAVPGKQPTESPDIANPLPTQPQDQAVVSEDPQSSNGETDKTIFTDQLDANWTTVGQDVDINLNNTKETFQGKQSIEVTPKKGFGSAYFVLGPNNTTAYTRSQILGVKFKLTGGDNSIEPSDLAIAILGSNQYTYYAANDHSVTSQYDPVFPETRLYHLQINQTIKPHVWVDITVWLDDLLYEPVYNNFTGFYIKNDETYLQKYYIDDVQLVLPSDINNLAVASPTQTTNQVTQSHPTINVDINISKNSHPINPMIYGISNAPADVLTSLKPGSNSWGGDFSSRYNWKLGNAWNTGRDSFYQNTDFGNPSGSASDRFIEDSQKAGASVRLTLPMLDWVAKDSDPKSCSFPLPDGSCGNADNATCINPGPIADPKVANVASSVDSIVKWVQHMLEDKQYAIQVFALDNEPELWGTTHYDVHPKCTTYQEILQKYLLYAEAVRKAAPKVDLAGPVTCCWQYYFDSAAGPMDKLQNGNEDFIPWFLDQVKAYDMDNGTKSINVLDIHYYPDGLYNQNVDASTAEHRLRATRSLWDPTYVDESWINKPVALIPRMKDIITNHYPGLKFGISEWNFGADQSINGALAIADVLGIFGREDVYYANYWTYPALTSPGAFAFKMFTNYDGKGGQFGDLSVSATSDTPDLIGSYASVDRKTNQLHLIIINKDPNIPLGVKANLLNFPQPSKVELYRYSQDDLKNIVKTDEKWPEKNGILIIPPYSINHYVLYP